MRLLILDSKSFEYKLDHKTPVGEDITSDELENKYDNPLVIFTAIEGNDEEQIINKAVQDIKKIADKNKNKLIIINPFAHLSANLAEPKKAIMLLSKLTEKLQEYPEFRTIKSVFGWYKQFSVDVKAHGNSQIYREY